MWSTGYCLGDGACVAVYIFIDTAWGGGCLVVGAVLETERSLCSTECSLGDGSHEVLGAVSEMEPVNIFFCVYNCREGCLVVGAVSEAEPV